MMRGYVDENDQSILRIKVIGNYADINVDAIVDTGFDGYISLPIHIAVYLGLELYGDIQVELADGSVHQELVFAGKVVFNNETRDVLIILSRSNDTLIGTKLLKNRIVTINYVNNTITVSDETR
ncbi:MAG TPA: clan AA aspartic protease [Methanosarcinales archaeon]|nr:clan AA aspartic protease [Methanosarcinales archaeon]